MRPLLKSTFLLTLIFAALVGIIRAQPYDDSELRAFLTPPDGCPMPCFMGIRPGVTTADEAIAILEAHEWVRYAYVSLRDLNDYPQRIIFTWSGRQPEFIAAVTNVGDEQDSIVQIEDNIVSAIWIPTTVPLGDFWMLWGVPDGIKTIIESGDLLRLGYRGFYAEYYFWTENYAYCPFFPVFWYSNVTLVLVEDMEQVIFRGDAFNLFLMSAAYLKHNFC